MKHIVEGMNPLDDPAFWDVIDTLRATDFQSSERDARLANLVEADNAWAKDLIHRMAAGGPGVAR